MSPIRDGDEVAILKEPNDLPSNVVEIVVVRRAGPIYVQLIDGRTYAALGGRGLNTGGCIVAAREEHRAALRKRNAEVVSS
jgi:hypothetical protein